MAKKLKRSRPNYNSINHACPHWDGGIYPNAILTCPICKNTKTIDRWRTKRCATTELIISGVKCHLCLLECKCNECYADFWVGLNDIFTDNRRDQYVRDERIRYCPRPIIHSAFDMKNCRPFPQGTNTWRNF